MKQSPQTILPIIASNGHQLSATKSGVASTSLDDSEKNIIIFGFNISHLPRTTQFLAVSAAVLIFFVIYGYVLEAIFVQENLKSHGLYLTFYQFFLYSSFAYIESKLKGEKQRRIPIPTYIIISFLTVSTMALSNLSLEYLNYPTQVIFKSCKLIPVLMGGIIIQGKRYGIDDFFAAAIMCAGLIWFTLVDVKVSPNFHFTGIVMISLALLADAVIGNVQEKAMKKYNATNNEVVFYSYLMGLAYLGFALLLTRSLSAGIIVAQQHPIEVYGYGFILSLAGYWGLNFVLTLVRVAGAFAAVTVTTCRKALSIAISFMFFAKPFSFQYVLSGSLVILGIYLNFLSKRRPVLELGFGTVARWVSRMLNSKGNDYAKTVVSV